VTARSAPAWLVQPQAALVPCACCGSRRRGSFVEKTLAGGADAVRTAIAADEIAHQPAVLQRLDARVKIAATLVLLVAVAFVHHVIVLAVCVLAITTVAPLTRVPLRRFVARVWLVVPLFTAFVAVPATLNVVTAGPVLVPLGTWFGHDLAVTTTGVTTATLLLLRVAASLSLVVLLTQTTAWPDLLTGLRGLRVPRLFVMVLAMAHRYLFLLLDTVSDMFVARRARTVAAAERSADGRRFVAASAGALFGKAHSLSEEVHMAMVARGYQGEAPALVATRVAATDLLVALGTVVAALAIIGGDRLAG
jgi:cobalt ECF transporter T component CbiQ